MPLTDGTRPDTLKAHAGDIARGVGKFSGGVANVGVSAFGAVALVFSVLFLTLLGLIDEPRPRAWVGGLLYRAERGRYERVTDRIVQTTPRYVLGNLAISAICGTAIIGVPIAAALQIVTEDLTAPRRARIAAGDQQAPATNGAVSAR
jgi:predicted PurR-regulated permease PerM